jgi:hypothetical protein
MMDQTAGYLVDQSHPPLVFAALQGLGEVLEHGLRRLEKPGTDISPIVVDDLHRLVVITLYQPEPVTIQVVQYDGQLERVTEILGAGIGMDVLREVRRTAGVLEVEPTSLSKRFKNRIALERAAHIDTYCRLRGDSLSKHSSFSEVFRRWQEDLRRSSGLQEASQERAKHPHPSYPFRRSFPKALRELELAADEILSGSWKRPVMEHVAELASALSEACRAEGLREAAQAARSISSLVSVSPDQLRPVEQAFRNKLVGLLYSLKTKAIDALGDTAS